MFRLLLLGLIAGCNSQVKAYCAEAMDCMNGNPEDEEFCFVDIQQDREQATIYDCKDDYNSFLACRMEKSDCVSSEDAPDTWTDEGKCTDKWEDYAQCLDDNSKIINTDE